MIFCTNCGQQNDDAARTCTNCGAALRTTGGSSPYTPPGTAAGGQWGETPSWATPPSGEQLQGVPPARAGLLAVGEKREPVMVLLFTFLTCGIYGFYWVYTTSTEMKNALGRADINPTLDVVLGLVTCGLYFIYLFYRYPQDLLQLQDRAALPRNDITMISILLAIFGLSIVSLFMIQTELNKVWDAAGRR